METLTSNPGKPKTKNKPVHLQDGIFEFISRYMVLTEDEKNMISELSVFRSCKKGTVLLKEGQRSNESYFVLKGCLRTYYMIEGEEKTTAFYTEYEAITPHCTATKEPSSYFVACVEDSIISVGDAEMDESVLEKFPRFEKLCRLVSEDLLLKNQVSFDDFKTASPEQRYLNLLHTRPDLLDRVPQHQIASFLGITRESLSRIRKRISRSVSAAQA